MTNQDTQLWLQWVNAAMQVDPASAIAAANDALKQYRKLQGLSDQTPSLQWVGDSLLNEIDGQLLDLYVSPIIPERNRAAELGLLEQCRSVIKSALTKLGCEFPPDKP